MESELETAVILLAETRAHLLAKSKVIEQLNRDLTMSQLAVSFFSTVIKGGGCWTKTCQRTHDLIMSKKR